MYISDFSLKELEFDKILTLCSEFCLSEMGKQRVLETLPSSKPELIQHEIESTRAYFNGIEANRALPLENFPNIELELKYLTIEDYILSEESFERIFRVLSLSKEIISFIFNHGDFYQKFIPVVEAIPSPKQLISQIQRVFNRYFEVKNDASPELAKIRSGIQKVKKTLQENFNKELQRWSDTDVLDEIKETVHDEFRVLAVKAHHKRRVRGRLVGYSKSGTICYILPENCLQAVTQLRELVEHEKKELRRILKELSGILSSDNTVIESNYYTLIRWDVLRAKALFSHQIEANFPHMQNEPCIQLIQAGHPLLLWMDAKKVVKNSIVLPKGKRMLTISGPNAGGKSITLKTIGLLQLMFQSGFLVPANERTKMGIFKKILTDIGDNQSSENQLSTYSARLKRMAEILQQADEHTLVLIDEFGTGSDPELGGVLAEAFLEYLDKKKCYCVITTHYTNIKICTERLESGLNACVLFDKQTLHPMYKLALGQAGSSFTFEVAERNNIPKSIIEAAQQKLSRQTANLDTTIAKLQQEKYDVERMKQQLSSNKSQSDELLKRLEAKEERLAEKLIKLNLALENVERSSKLGEKFMQWIKEYANGASKRSIQLQFWKIMEFEAHKINKKQEQFLQVPAKRVAESLMKDQYIQKKIKEKKVQSEEQQPKKEIFSVGDKVKLKGSVSVATIEKIEKNKLTLNYGSFSTITGADQVEKI